ncbi:MAG: FMN-binding protein [Phyllobacterium sp.]|uniref:FMN-binding protein n=1 Tax=Phyllobacterium sp. TaxID=1871046 RepID=UPI0030EFEFAA
MKRLALSIFVITASGAYVLHQVGNTTADDPLRSTRPVSAEETVGPLEHISDRPIANPMPLTWPAPAEALESTSTTLPSAGKPDATASRPSPIRFRPALDTMNKRPIPAITADYIQTYESAPDAAEGQPRVVRATLTARASRYVDGVYTGPAADAYYGLVQLQAVIQNGRLSAIKILQYPSDRRTSIYINRQALPLLRDEAVSAQSAKVDIVSGATLTSRAFIRSLGGALQQAAL